MASPLHFYVHRRLYTLICLLLLLSIVNGTNDYCNTLSSCGDSSSSSNSSSDVLYDNTISNVDIQREWLPPPSYHNHLINDNVCTILRVSGDSLPRTSHEFYRRFMHKDSDPVILVNITNNALFKSLTTRTSLLKKFGDKDVVLSTANTYSYKKVIKTFMKYVTDHMKPRASDEAADEALYMFGDNRFDDANWDALFKNYVRPPFLDSYERGSLSWGLSGSGAGVPLHTHGRVFAEVLHGRKRWFLFPPGTRPPFEPDVTSYNWLKDVYPTLTDGGTVHGSIEASKRDNSSGRRLLECTLGPDEVLFMNDNWWHSTLNIGESVFISTFV